MAAPIVSIPLLTLTPLSQSVFVELAVPVPSAVVCDVLVLTTLGVVLPLTPVTVVVASFFVVGVTELATFEVVGVPRPVSAVTESPLALTAPPLALAEIFVVETLFV